MPKPKQLKYLLVVWVLCSFVLSTLYKGIVVGEFQKPSWVFPPDSLEELVEQKKDFMIVMPHTHSRRNLRKDHTVDVLLKFQTRMASGTNIEMKDDCDLLASVNNGKAVWIDMLNNIVAFLSFCQERRNQSVINTIFASEEFSAMLLGLNFAVRRRNTGLSNHVEKVVQRLRSFGIMDYLRKKFRKRAKISTLQWVGAHLPGTQHNIQCKTFLHW